MNNALFHPHCSQLRLPTAVFIYQFSSHCCVCVYLEGLNAEHKFWVWVTILGYTSHHLVSGSKFTFKVELIAFFI